MICPICGDQFDTTACPHNSLNKTQRPFKCPVCDGTGLVSRPPWIAGDVESWDSDRTSYECSVCNGDKIIWK